MSSKRLSRGTPGARAEDRQGHEASAGGPFRALDLCSLAGLITFLLSVLVMLWAADAGHIVSDDKKAVASWSGSDFATLAWIANLGLCGAVAIQLRTKLVGLLPLCSVFGMIGFVVGFVVVAIAFGAERQNYWDAVHFSSLLWLSIGGATSALAAARVAAKRGSEVASYLVGPAAVCALMIVLVWAWTWFPPLQELQADIARSVYLGLHG